METNDKLPTTTTASEAAVVVNEKRENWANFGERTHYLGMELVASADKIKSSLPMPTEISQINATEAALKVAKQETNKLVESRKSVTNVVNVVFGKLMAPEKDLAEVYIPAIEKKLIELKREKKTADDLVQAKADEQKRLKEEAIKYINDYDLLFKQEINKKVAGAFEYALGVGNIDNEGLPKFLTEAKGKLKAIQFVVKTMKPVLKNVTEVEFSAIWESLAETIKAPEFYVGKDNSLYETELTKKFEFYEVALLNKEGALKQSQTIDAKNDEQLKKENASANVAATMQSMATGNATVATEQTKALKQKFELDMPEGEQSAMLIIAAFAANIDLTRPYVKASWFKLTVTQMGATLVALKNNDDKFSFTGIKFKTVDKL